MPAISEVRAFPIRLSAYDGPPLAGRRDSWLVGAEVANPMSHYPRYKALRDSWRPPWPQLGCIVTADDGSWGFGLTNYAALTGPLINDHLGPRLLGEPADDPAHVYDMMVRLVSPLGAAGVAAFAMSAFDLALWDLKAKSESRPVYDLIGGPAREAINCYATGNDTDWQVELGFDAVKLACPFGPADGEAGLAANTELVAAARETIGPNRKLMLDCWMAFDVDYAVALYDRLQPYDLYWMEDSLTPEDILAHHELRQRLPGKRLATGEHWYGTHPFAYAAEHQLADVFQPDICWVGGLTPCLEIARVASEAGIHVILHAGMNTPYGQHFTHAAQGASMGEFFQGSAPGVPLEKATNWPGLPVPLDGKLAPTDAPGFGIGFSREELEAMAV